MVEFVLSCIYICIVLSSKFAEGEVRRFISDCLVACGASKENAAAHAEVVVAADVRGHYSHGLQRLDLYVCELREGATDGCALPRVVREAASSALVDGNNGLGTVVGNFCMDLAIEKARNTGIACVCTKGSNHYGIAGWYAIRASKQGLIGMSFTNAFPGVLATRAKEAFVGTNPISMAAPGKKSDNFELDMATSVVASGKVELALLKKESIPLGWMVDEKGQMTSDPSSAATSGILLPLGGTEMQSGYKGTGLGMMVEILCGILSGKCSA
ncbi:malate dehydrogenase [Chionoecetes opilio]|uniref:Malate dehydrogenase n=1 Tax=Chionoecetes opilio TaxID=41210 RepID=A0A8J4YMI4_CHIOP|nr:malate dehydrogenase [Chionoecetes opilio]